MRLAHRRSRFVLALAGCAVLLGAATVLAQRGFNSAATGSGAPILPNTKYDGRFMFVRVRYGPPVEFQAQRIPWSHDYPEGEHKLMQILNEISYLGPHVEETNVMALDDPELYKFPLIYLCEPGTWSTTDKEAAAFREYLQRGGFVIADDFRYNQWPNFEAQMRRIIPDVRFYDLDASHPIFHSFFEITSPHDIPQYYDTGPPIFRGVFEDNDPTKRLMMAISYNTDISEFWEWSGTGFKPIDESNEAFKIGVNFFLYGMTH